MDIKIFTIGVYGFSELNFFQSLKDAEIDTFCDLRARRGVRGSLYTFANSQRLQNQLAEMNIHYLHSKNLAPSSKIRKKQYAEDKSSKISKRQRTELGQAFISGYQEEVLSHFDSSKFIEDLPSGAKNIVLFCVEKDPHACHRSLVAGKLKEDLQCAVLNLYP